MLTDTRTGVVYPDPNVEAEQVDVPRDIAQIVAALQKTTLFRQGLASGRGSSSAATAGTWYYATDTATLSYDYGSGFLTLGSASTTYVDDTSFANALIFGS